MRRTSLVLRSLFLLGFVIAMPLLALPTVARWADELLYGDPPPEDSQPTSLDEDSSAEHDRQVVQAVLEATLADSGLPVDGKSDTHGLDAAVVHPPVMPPTPDFPAPLPDVSPAAGALEPTAERLAEIRQRLVDLGADYIRLEADSQTGQYHCHCRMLIAPDAAETRTFEANGDDPTAVAEQVLRAVEGWRTSLTAPSLVQ